MDWIRVRNGLPNVIRQGWPGVDYTGKVGVGFQRFRQRILGISVRTGYEPIGRVRFFWGFIAVSSGLQIRHPRFESGRGLFISSLATVFICHPGIR